MLKKFGYLVCVGMLICMSNVWSFQRGNELVGIPSARMEVPGYLEVGGGVSGGLQSSSQIVSEGDVFARFAFSDRFEYGITDLNDKLYHHLQVGFEPLGTPTQSAHLAVGLKNIGWTAPAAGVLQPASTVIGAYIVTSFQFRKSGAWLHAGFAENKLTARTIGFLGLEYDLLFGRVSVEWDGQLYSFGYRAALIDSFQLTIGVQTRFKNATQVNENPESLRIGLSIIDPPASKRRELFVEELSPTKDKLVSPNMQSTSNILATANSVTSSNSRVVLDVTGNRVVTSNVQLLKLSLSHMQLGNQYYYQGMFQEALGEYLAFVKLNPELAEGYVAVGSIYKQMGLVEEAEVYWKKALVIDPENAQIRAYEAANLKKKL